MYACDSTIKLLDIENGATINFQPFVASDTQSPSPGINLLTASSAIGKFAFSDTQLSPKVYVFDLDTENRIKEESRLLGAYNNNRVLYKKTTYGTNFFK